MESKKSGSKIADIVRLQQIMKKWKKLAAVSSSPRKKNQSRPVNFSFSSGSDVPKGFVAVCVGPELRRFVIPMGYLTHEAFAVLLKEAEDEFGFEQEGVLKIPCQEATFQNILKEVIMIEGKMPPSDNSPFIFPRDRGSCCVE